MQQSERSCFPSLLLSRRRSSATVFAPSDSAFKKSAQPSLDVFRFHLTAVVKIPTMLLASLLRFQLPRPTA
ncbi:hypothetical protein ACSQ67_013728 [Phaseolus vulgaris]